MWHLPGVLNLTNSIFKQRLNLGKEKKLGKNRYIVLKVPSIGKTKSDNSAVTLHFKFVSLKLNPGQRIES